MRNAVTAYYYCCYLLLFVALRIPILVKSFRPSALSSDCLWHSRRRSSVTVTTVERCTVSPSSSSSSSLSHSLVDQEESVSAAWKNDLTLHDLQELLATAQEAARAAGNVIRSHLGCCSEQAQECEIKYSIKDIVTEYDQQAQRAVESIVRNKYPTHGFLGEEDVAPGAAASQAALEQRLQQARSPFLWICDPIDGTANFAAGLELCAVTMGVVYQGTPIVGVVYDPHRDEMFSALKGHGATLTTRTTAESDRGGGGDSSSSSSNLSNDQGEKEVLLVKQETRSMQVAQAVTSVNEAIVNAGCPADPNAFQTSMRGVLALNGQARGLRMIACSALTLAWIASGRLAAHFGYDLSSWDLVAGALLIQESGGRVTDLDGSEYKLETRNMLCSNGYIHNEILEILRAADAVSFTRSL